MDHGTTQHVKELADWSYNHAAAIWFGVSLLAGAIFWFLRQYFATRAAVERNGLENTQEHDKIDEKIERVKDKIDDIKDLILKLHGVDK